MCVSAGDLIIIWVPAGLAGRLKVLSSGLICPQVVSFGWTVLLLPFQRGRESPSQDHPVLTYWEAQGSSGKQQVTVLKNCHSSASLVCTPPEHQKKKEKNLNFLWLITTLYTCVCSADAGRSIVCGYGSTTLQCCSGQVLAVNGGFHALENTYYCWSRQPSLTAPPQVQCGWVDVTKSLTGTQRLDAVFYRVVFVSIKCKAVARSRGVQSAECRMRILHSAGLWAALPLLFHGPQHYKSNI